VENQRRELDAVAERNGWHVAKLLADEGMSGDKSRDRRPGFARREFDVVAAWSVDRLGRSLQDLIGLLGEMKAKGVDLYLHQQGLDTSTPAGKAMFQMLGVFAEFERAMIQERVKAGLARARAQGRRLGRPMVGSGVEDAVRAARADGKGIRRIARELKIGVGTVQRIVAEMPTYEVQRHQCQRTP
jgi:DNA invertase Pin-like site-specific DNA recombinase